MWIAPWAVGLSALVHSGDPCMATAGHHAYTILLDSGGHFFHCREGEETETPPVSEERVVLQLPPVDPSEPYRFRLVNPGNVAPVHPHRLFSRQLDLGQLLEDTLHDLAESNQGLPAAEPPPLAEPSKEAAGKEPTKETTKEKQHIREILTPIPLANSAADALKEVNQRRSALLEVMTPQFSEAVRQILRGLPVVEATAGETDAVCHVKESALPSGPLKAAIDQRCAKGGPGKTLLAAIKPFVESAAAFSSARHGARLALLDLSTKPTTPAEQSAAAKETAAALQKATAAARALIELAPQTAKDVQQYVRDLGFLQLALSIPPSAAEGRRIPLGRFPAASLFSAPAIYQLSVSREPSALFDLAGSEQAEPQQEVTHEVLVDRFEPVAHRYLNIELGLAYSTGLPDHPDLSGRLGDQTLTPVKTQGFVGGILASLEPMEFGYAEYPWSGLLRFPTIMIPFTLNPLSNYFVGGGIGWNDVGSINVGVHLAVTTVPGDGTPYGTTFKTSPILLDHVTQAGPVAGGFFISASLDILGIIHLFFEQEQPKVRDVYSGGEVGAH
jgi:hypothetical protein